MSVWCEATTWKVNWESERELPGGGQASARVAKSIHTEHIAFIKTLNKQSDAERRARFFREASAYSTFNHPGLPRLIESNATHHENFSYKLYIASEFVPGPTLTSAMLGNSPPSFHEAVALVGALLDIVEYFHRKGWIHRDIKPDNIILRDGAFDRPILLDFGIGHHDDPTDSFRTKEGEELGNRFLRLPELAVGSPVKQDARSDLSFVGGIFFYALTGKPPAVLIDDSGRSPHQRDDLLSALRSATGHALIPVLSFFDRTLVNNLAHRFASVADMRSALEIIMQEHDRPGDGSADEDLRMIRMEMERDVHARDTELLEKYRIALSKIDEVLTSTQVEIGRGFNKFYTGWRIKVDRACNILGLVRSTDDRCRFTPKFEVYASGEELVIEAGHRQIYRTALADPSYGDDFAAKIRALYIKGVSIALQTPAAVMPERDLFMEPPSASIDDALFVAKERGSPIFAVVYDSQHPKFSDLSYALGHFLGFDATKRLVADRFVAALVPATDPGVRSLIPSDDPLELARWFLLDADGRMLETKSVYANREEGLKEIRKLVERHAEGE